MSEPDKPKDEKTPGGKAGKLTRSRWRAIWVGDLTRGQWRAFWVGMVAGIVTLFVFPGLTQGSAPKALFFSNLMIAGGIFAGLAVFELIRYLIRKWCPE